MFTSPPKPRRTVTLKSQPAKENNASSDRTCNTGQNSRDKMSESPLSLVAPPYNLSRFSEAESSLVPQYNHPGSSASACSLVPQYSRSDAQVSETSSKLYVPPLINLPTRCTTYTDTQKTVMSSAFSKDHLPRVNNLPSSTVVQDRKSHYFSSDKPTISTSVSYSNTCAPYDITENTFDAQTSFCKEHRTFASVSTVTASPMVSDAAKFSGRADEKQSDFPEGAKTGSGLDIPRCIASSNTGTKVDSLLKDNHLDVALSSSYSSFANATGSGASRITTDVSSNNGLESALLDQALTHVLSLPEVVTEVAVKNKDQSCEISRQQNELKHLKDIQKKEKEKLNGLKEEHDDIKRQCCVGESDIANTLHEIDKIRKHIESAVKDATKLETNLAGKADELEQQVALFDKQTSQMAEFRARVQAAESSELVFVKLKAQQEKVDSLLKEKMALCSTDSAVTVILSGQKEKELQTQIHDARHQARIVKQAFDITTKRIEDKRSSCAHKRQEIDVLNKRNTAQLKCRKRQLKEALSRRSQWNEQAQLLEAEITHLKRQLEQMD